MSDKKELHRILEVQKKAHLRDGPLSIEQRKEWIDRLINSIIEYQDKIPVAISKDFNFHLDIKESSKKMFLSGNWDATSTLLKNENLIERKNNDLPYLKFSTDL